MPIYFAWFTTALLSVGGDTSNQNLPQSGRFLYCVVIPVAVEKLAYSECAKIGSRQEALQTIFPVSWTFSITRFSTFFTKTDLFNSHPCSRQLSGRERKMHAKNET